MSLCDHVLGHHDVHDLYDLHNRHDILTANNLHGRRHQQFQKRGNINGVFLIIQEPPVLMQHIVVVDAEMAMANWVSMLLE